MKAVEFFKDNGLSKCSRIVEDLMEQGVESEFVKDLKRLAGSHELIIKDFESIEVAKYEYMVSGSHSDPYWTQVKQAILDVESCQ